MVAVKTFNVGMIVSLKGKLYRIESCSKDAVKKVGETTVKLRSLIDDEVIEKSLKHNGDVKEVFLKEKVLEFFYPEKDGYLFLDISTLENVFLPKTIIEEKILFLKPGVQIFSKFYGDTVFSVELPQFLELMISKTESVSDEVILSGETKQALLETGASIKVPPFIEIGDIIKVDTRTSEYIQRV